MRLGHGANGRQRVDFIKYKQWRREKFENEAIFLSFATSRVAAVDVSEWSAQEEG